MSFISGRTSVCVSIDEWRSAGGGFDYRFDSVIALRVQADYLGSRFGGAFQRNPQLVTGIVWNV